MINDTFKKKFHRLSVDSTDFIVLCKEKAEELEALFDKYPSREMTFALINLEQAIMWCTKAIVIEDEKSHYRGI